MVATRITASIAFMVALSGSLAAWGQSYPARPIRVVTAGVGGGGDFITRMLAPGLSAVLGQPVIVDNRSGAVVLNETVARSAPDGHTLLINSDSLWVSALLQKVPYDPLKDFLPVSILDRSPNVLVVHASIAANSVKDLIALARANAGKFNFATGPTGVPNHVSGELFKALAGINIVRVAYGGGGPALNSVLAGETQLMFASAPSVAQHVKSGKLKALAVTSAQRSALAPELPTIADSGLPGYAVEPVDGMFVPAVVRLVRSDDIKDKFLRAGVEAVGSTAQELAILMKSEMTKWEKVFRSAGMLAQ
jgi:tripartite-type tricarboxylate transporter receptor subunit TctC